ncbi:outer membrane lipoprotein LolB [Legionella busanensis]|uniref:Outer-membrane lipoprotein LolB n=1 Tax=Legionella busanensis TaxID=190655 RepID=A0A378JWV8_9GAMM|nr:lipoprotein insertase outer membrane protein LolB [Legionella busanensis]STX52702.1 outer membrane lipoprotein LolB [Legionella busanensis]
MKSLKYASLLTLSFLTACVSTRQPTNFESMPPQYNMPAPQEGGTIVKNPRQQSQLKLDSQNTNANLAQTNNKISDKNLANNKLVDANLKTDKKQITQAARGTPSSWNLSGALAVRSARKSATASINWYQRGAGSYQIRLFGPLGSGTIMIAKQGGTIVLQDGAKRATSSNAEQLLLKQTGIRLPVNNLYYWVRGLPAPGAVQSAKRDAGNRLIMLRQGGYTIQYLGYQSVGKAVLPSHIRLQGNGVFIKLVINRWSI